MSTAASQSAVESSWKEEVNRRLAMHNSRKGSATAGPEARTEIHPVPGSRAAQAAARVAARFAQAPSYNEVLAGDARAALRAAEAAAQAALHAQAAAEVLLAGLEAVACEEQAVESAPAPVSFSFPVSVPVAIETQAPHVERIQEPAPRESFPAARYSHLISPGQSLQNHPVEVRWEPELPARSPEPFGIRVPREPESFDPAILDWGQPADADEEMQPFLPIEPDQPIHANLIEFPRELVATRKIRPRLASGQFTASVAPQGQLSIFEVDPAAVSIEPAMQAEIQEQTVPEWSGIQLDAHPAPEPVIVAAASQPAVELHPAPMGFRLMALLVDGSLVTAAFFGAVLAAAANIKHPPELKLIEMSAVGAFFFIGVLYQALFFTLAEATPGMRYAQISLCTFDDQKPTRAQRRQRVGALLLSLLPVGLGLVWALFDEDHLSWHDRLSHTYQRKG